MIDLYTWTTGNGRKIVIMLEEVGLDYEVHPVNIYKGEQFAADFLKISPNNKVPAIIDRDGPGGKALSVFESAACLMYLAEKTGKLMPSDIVERYDVIQWLVLTVAGLGPAIGQAHYFHGPGKDANAAAAARFTRETARMFNVLDRRLCESPWIGGAEYSIADISAVGRVAGYKNAGVDINETPALAAWLERVDARPASRRAAKVIADLRATHATPVDDAARDIMYGDTQFARR